MEYFDKRMAIDVIEDAFTAMDTPHSCGVIAGLCDAFYMCGLLSAKEWKAFLKRIPAEPYWGPPESLGGKNPSRLRSI